MGRSGWRWMARKLEANSTTEIELTPEMIEAGVKVFFLCPFFDISRGPAEELTEEILRRALSMCCSRIDEGDHEAE
jgi:hypothetical protein